MPKKLPVTKVGDKEERENYIQLPKDFEAPDVEEGETFEAVVEIRKEKDGHCIVSLDGVPMDEKGDPNDEELAGEESIGAGAKRMAMKGGY